MNKAIFEDIEMYLSQLQDFLQSDKKVEQLTIKANKTSEGDHFTIDYDKDNIGSLILMLASDQTLCMLAQFALIHMMSLQSELEIEEHFKKMIEMSKDLRREINGNKEFHFLIRKNKQLS